MADIEQISEKVKAGEKVSDSDLKELMSTPNIEPQSVISRQEEDSDSEADSKDESNQEDGAETHAKKDSEDESKKEESDAETSEATKETDDKKDVKPAKETNEADLRKKLEAELDKPYGEEDLSDYSSRERALFFEMRRERRKRQETQEELDLFKFRDLKKKAETLDDSKEEKDSTKQEPDDLFSGRDEEEFLTVGDVKKILAKQSKDPISKDVTPEVKKHLQGLHEQNMKLLQKTWFLEGQQKHPSDFMDVLDLASDLLDGDKKAEEEIQETAKRGGNPALTTYNLVKAHPKFKEKANPKEEVVESDDDQGRDITEQRAKKIEANSKKPRTTGAGGGSPSSEYSLEELVNMSDEDFSKISPEKRKKLLQFYS